MEGVPSFSEGYRFFEGIFIKVFHFHFQHEGNLIITLKKKGEFKRECSRSVFSNTVLATSHMQLI